MPNCQRCGHFTLLPDLCVDCAGAGPGPVVPTPAAPPPPAYASSGQPVDWQTSDWFGAGPVTATVPPASFVPPTPPLTPRPILPAGPPLGAPYGRSPYAGIGRRGFAYLLDIAAVLVLFFLLGVVAGITGIGAGADATMVLGGWTAIMVLYFYVPESHSGRTLGKALLGIRVVRADDLLSPPGYGYGAVRRLVFVSLGLAPLGGLINLAVAGSDNPEHRAVHDRAARTRVVRADWSPAEGYPSYRQPTSVTSIVLITLACILSVLLSVAMVVSVVLPVFLTERAKGVDAQMRQDAEDAARALVGAQGTLAFPIVIEEGTVGVIGSTTFEPAPGDSIRITVARDGSGAFCVRVANDDAPSPLYLDNVAGTISTVRCGYRGRTTVFQR